MAIESKKDLDGLPFVEDLLHSTQTTRDEWCFGGDEIAAVSGINLVRLYKVLNKPGGLAATKYRGVGSGIWFWVVRRSDVLEWAQRYRAAEKAQEETWRKQREAAEAAKNGAKAAPVQPEQPKELFLMKEPQILLARADAENIIHTTWKNHLATEHLTRSVDHLTTAVEGLTGEVKKLRQTWSSDETK